MNIVLRFTNLAADVQAGVRCLGCPLSRQPVYDWLIRSPEWQTDEDDEQARAQLQGKS